MGIEFTRSRRPEEVIPDSCDKCERGLNHKRILDKIFNFAIRLECDDVI